MATKPKTDEERQVQKPNQNPICHFHGVNYRESNPATHLMRFQHDDCGHFRVVGTCDDCNKAIAENFMPDKINLQCTYCESCGALVTNAYRAPMGRI